MINSFCISLYLIIYSTVSLIFTQGLVFDKRCRIDKRLMSRTSRPEFLQILTKGIVDATTASIFLNPLESSARGRATLEQSYDRYAPRIIAGGAFYKNELKKAIDKSDWAFLKAATSEPPPRTKEDRSKPDGGISERAAKAGGFSDAKVLVAADLFASAFSDNAITTKTKSMQAEVEKMRQVVQMIHLTAQIALGEEKPQGSGGFFGFGAKVPSQSDLLKEVRDLYLKGGNAFNQYAYYANEGLPIQLNKIPYL